MSPAHRAALSRSAAPEYPCGPGAHSCVKLLSICFLVCRAAQGRLQGIWWSRAPYVPLSCLKMSVYFLLDTALLRAGENQHDAPVGPVAYLCVNIPFLNCMVAPGLAVHLGRECALLATCIAHLVFMSSTLAGLGHLLMHGV